MGCTLLGTLLGELPGAVQAQCGFKLLSNWWWQHGCFLAALGG